MSMFLMKGSLPTSHLLLIAIVFALFASLSHAQKSSADELPPIRTEVRYEQSKESKNDDPEEAWEEWDETETTRKNPFPKRQRPIGVGMDVNAILGMAMKQPKVVTAVLSATHATSDTIGNLITQKYRNQMAAAGIGCRLWYVPKGRQVIANCESIRDGHAAKDYMIRQHEIIRTVLDNVPFTPVPVKDDDDDDDDDESSKAVLEPVQSTHPASSSSHPSASSENSPKVSPKSPTDDASSKQDL